MKTASGATAVQIVEKRNGRRRIVEHIGSAHDDTELAVLISAAQQRLHGHQDEMLPIETLRRDPAAPVVDRTASQLLWTVLTRAFAQLGFDAVGDEVFTALVAARIIEPTSKVDTLRVLADLGISPPHVNTSYNCLARCVRSDYRSQIATACWAHVLTSGPVALVMYDPTRDCTFNSVTPIREVHDEYASRAGHGAGPDEGRGTRGDYAAAGGG